MGTQERKLREKQQRVDLIIDSAEKTFFSKGLDVATIDDVAAAAEISKGAIYIYFKSKEELVAAILVRALKKLQNLFAEHVAKEKTGIDKVCSMGNAYLNFSTRSPFYFELLFNHRLQKPGSTKKSPYALECARQGSLLFEIVADAVALGHKDGTIRIDLDPMQTAVVLWGQMHGIIAISHREGDHLKKHHSLEMEDIVSVALDVLRNGIGRRSL